jgi:hypothetical protein
MKTFAHNRVAVKVWLPHTLQDTTEAQSRLNRKSTINMFKEIKQIPARHSSALDCLAFPMRLP